MKDTLREAWRVAPPLSPDPASGDTLGVAYQNLIENAIDATVTTGFIDEATYERLIAPWVFFRGRVRALID